MSLHMMADSSEFMKGYIYAKLEDQFSSDKIGVDIDDTEITVYSWPDELRCDEIKEFLESFCWEYHVQIRNPNKDACPDPEVLKECPIKNFEEGRFLPELSPFFPTMLAQPHILGYSAGYRSADKIFKSTLPVSIGDQFSLFQFKITSSSNLYLGIEACVWAIFEAKYQSLSLINADYYVALPLTYIKDKLSARLRFFHESSHLGDEFLLETKIKRVNPSMEGVDISLAYEVMDDLVCFIGYRNIFRSDDSFHVKPSCFYYGFNYFLNFATLQTFHVQAKPYLGVYFTNQENNHWGFDGSVAFGYQWNKCYGRKLRIYLMGHDGYSAEGQFARRKSKYVSINLLYGY